MEYWGDDLHKHGSKTRDKIRFLIQYPRLKATKKLGVKSPSRGDFSGLDVGLPPGLAVWVIVPFAPSETRLGLGKNVRTRESAFLSSFFSKVPAYLGRGFSRLHVLLTALGGDGHGQRLD